MKGHKYWYYQYTEPSGKLRQAYVGPDNDAVRRLMKGRDLPAASAGRTTAPFQLAMSYQFGSAPGRDE